jgi:LytS/YehU family sensor histidine kinase
MPPMLLQPIIENCFEHAFNESIENPQIVLEFNKITSGILIKVNDNGIGFKQSKTHKSKGIKLVEERLVLLNPKNHLSIYTEFGTSVEIFIQED